MGRNSKELTSPAVGRLPVGAIIDELEMSDNRIHYKKLDGDGPESGWVSVSSKGVALLETAMFSFDVELGEDQEENETEPLAEPVVELGNAQKAAATLPPEEGVQLNAENVVDFERASEVVDFEGASEEFAKVPSPKGFGLRTGHGTFVSADEDLRTVKQAKSFAGAWEEFVEAPTPEGFCLK